MPIQILARVDPARNRVEARTEHDELLVLDAGEPDGDGSAPSPKETLLAALAGCTSMDVASILRKKRQVATTYEVAVSGDVVDEHPRVFSAITVEHRVSGQVEPEALRRSIELSATRYCPVSALLSKGVEIEHRYRVTLSDGSQRAGLVVVTGPDGSRPG